MGNNDVFGNLSKTSSLTVFFCFISTDNIEHMITKQIPIIRNRIRFCRTSYNLKQKQLAFLMGVKETQISKWEQGVMEPGGYNTVGLAVATGRLVEEVFFDYRKEWQETVRKRWKLLNTVEKTR